jgi:membrane-bound lytic murein transglycosylase D
VERAVERTGYADFFELRNRAVIPLETTNYVPIILAMTIMAKNATEYGLENLQPDPPLEYDTIDLTAHTHLALISDLTDVPVSELLGLNPALLRNVAPADYALRVPKGTASTLRASLEMIPPERRRSWRMHKVSEGETLAGIGRQYGAAASVIAAANKLEFGDPRAGDRLVIPTAFSAPAATRTPVKAAVSRTPATRRSPARRKPVTQSAHVRERSTTAAVR